MSSSSDNLATKRALRGRLRRVGVALLVPPVVTLAVFFAGLGVGHIQTEHYELRFGVVLLLVGPVAPAMGFTASVLLSSALFGSSRFGRVLTVAVSAVNLVTALLVWGFAFRHFIGTGWG